MYIKSNFRSFVLTTNYESGSNVTVVHIFNSRTFFKKKPNPQCKEGGTKNIVNTYIVLSYFQIKPIESFIWDLLGLGERKREVGFGREGDPYQTQWDGTKFS